MAIFVINADFAKLALTRRAKHWQNGIISPHTFGGGNAQLDFRDMKFDWACG